MQAHWYWLFGCLMCACTIEPVDLTGRACPCAEGWTCDPATSTCVPILIDAGRMDAGRLDAGRVDSGGIDSGRVDSGGVEVDAGMDAGPADTDAGAPSSCVELADRTDILFCDGMEDESLAPWRLRPDTGNVLPWTGARRRGLQSAQGETTVTMEGGRADIASPYWTGVTSGEIHYRAWYLIPFGFTEENFAIMISTEQNDPYQGFALHVRAGNRLFLFSEMSGSLNAEGTAPVPRDTWFCVQARVSIHDTNGTYEVSVNGTTIISESGVDTRPAGGYAGVGVGVSYTSSVQGPATVFVDEVAVGTSVIPCD